MQVELSGKVIVITGAARGIGATAAILAAESGAEALVLTDRDPIGTECPCPVETVAADLSDPAAAGAIIDAATARFGRVDGLLNAAGVTTRAGFDDATPDGFDRIMAINTRAPFFLMARAIADMTGRGAPGSIVNIQSMNAHCGPPNLAVYSASKAAVATLTKAAANAHMADRIRVNGINLGWVDTETERHLHDVQMEKGAGWLAAQGAMQPIGRFVSQEDTARHCVWLLSDASAPMSGVSVDLEQWVVGAPPR
ncbi:SDR family oxidoreductase [Rhodobacterales bacterium HKCCE2091]|nr:SDR family oxidoreductase [Rhodobacterales bacterium HKCCE2091]